jgi:hypothetical protein
MDHQLYISFFTFMLPDGDLDLHFTNHLRLTDGTMALNISGSIVGGTGSYADTG